ncbi:hypothetical protein BSZ39_08295 [Bowdeniella nasicola]|uniref:HNH Cas9-type domain-containing protein n=1 Tax=Bowdeniella nasicola TaxID=208480 RepID=A0A1Q5Q1I4_9ACTO|nr:type II CRISPR RNA-guided endonuclease Cas9 [Bowdeniella nasicola]OKL53677.1 hypothetical protein BSZ39_08295 [Bowdeniella nasicola]
MADLLPYVVGIDVGTHSIGAVAIEVDEKNNPISILNAVVHIHDSGVDPDKRKTAESRLKTAGVARRTRRLTRRRRRRLQQLDALLEHLGYPFPDLAERPDPHTPWKVRARLVRETIADEHERKTAISIALRHIARHRGWRNPYSRVESLLHPAEDSQQLLDLKERVKEIKPELDLAAATSAEVITSVDMYNVKFRGPEGMLGGKLMQSDNANEIRRICEMQGVPDDEARRLIQAVFKAESPRGSSAERIGFDALPGQTHMHRAAKAHPSFQLFRMLSILTNLRIREGKGQTRRLSVDELQLAVGHLTTLKPKVVPIWADVAEVLGIERSQLVGTATPTVDGERAAARPPVDETSRRMQAHAPKSVKAWWVEASDEEQAGFIEQVTDGIPSETPAVRDFFDSLDDDDLVALDSLTLTGGRAAYSVNSLDRLSERMLHTGEDLHEARKSVFGVDDDWAPPVPSIGEPVGNPAVDRVLRQIARWLLAVEKRWGEPKSINIEHVRDGFSSEAVSRELDRQYNKRREINERYANDLKERLNLSGPVTRSDIIRYSAVERQNSACAYCGREISFFNVELDHIVPRRGLGSTNRRDNLVAVCERCNRSKKNIPFVTWAAKADIPGVSLEEAISRVKFWVFPPGQMNAQQISSFKREVIARLKQRDFDPPLDGRSMESVAWMANELHGRVKAHFAGASVRVFRGSITAAARKASGLERQIRFFGERGKTRLDRRHHAFDAACVAMMRPKVAEILTIRSNLRESQRLSRETETWKNYSGADAAEQFIYANWLEQMQAMGDLFNDALDKDQVVVRENLRLRLANGAAHDATIRKLQRKFLGEEFSVNEIDKAATPALWCALTRHPDFDNKNGLVANPDRVIRVNGTTLRAGDDVELFAQNSASIKVRGGSAEVGNSIHHARVYRIDKGSRAPAYGMVRVFQQDLLAHRHDDLFTTELKPQSLSFRYADATVKRAISEGRATYLGWIVVGDEIRLDASQVAAGKIAEFMKEYPTIRSWRLDGFFSNSKLRLRPILLAAEGLSENASEASKAIIDRPGWVPAVNVVFGQLGAQIVRRTTLGELRTREVSGMPISWSV